MLLLAFTMRNHKSIRDEIVLDFTRPALRTLRPKPGEAWKDLVYPLLGIFGANATGKSAILDAFNYAFSAIESSSTTWLAGRHMRFAPFLLDGVSKEGSSCYEFDFVSDERRYVYGFEVDARGIVREWLKDVPSSRWRTLLERDRESGTLRFHSSVRALGAVSDRELVLSRAHVVEHPQLGAIAADMLGSFDHVSVKDNHRESRLNTIAESLMDNTLTFDDIVTLLQVADIGVEKVTVEEKDLPPRFIDAVRSMYDALRGEDDDVSDERKEALEQDESDLVMRSLLFTHRGTGDDPPPFSIHGESDGTIAWLALMVPALDALRSGGIYCVDEIDSSLHPHLLDVVLGMFADPQLNTKGAQLVFTSHETYILSPLSEVALLPEQVWFTDKTYDGVTELACLADFPRHRDANIAKRYLTGRYGGTPRVAPGALAALVEPREG